MTRHSLDNWQNIENHTADDSAWPQEEWEAFLEDREREIADEVVETLRDIAGTFQAD